MKQKSLETSVEELAQAFGLLLRRLRATTETHELSMSESAVMARLIKCGAATTADLARAEKVRPQSMGATVAALEERGFVERKPHPTDGRQVNIEITGKGIAVRDSAKNAKRTWLAQAVRQLDEQDRATLLAAGEIIKRLVEL